MRRVVLLVLTLFACGDDDASGLDEYLPDVPEPTGDPQSVYAGEVSSGNAGDELIPGAAASGMVGDFYLRNARVRTIVQAPTRVIGVVPQGGNLVDAQPIGPDGPIGDDQFGELSAIYILGRTCEHETVEVVQDGSGGGAAAIRARGHSAANDFLNLKGLGLVNVPADLDPVFPDEIECATTYLLRPDSPTVEVFWTFYNAGDRAVRGPFATFTDTGGSIDAWAHGRGFERLGFEALADPDAEPAPTEYAVFQGPGVAYGLVPQHAAADTPNTAIVIVGVSIVLFGADELYDFVTPEGTYFDLEGSAGVTHGVHFVAGQDAADVEEAVRATRGEATRELSGRVTWEGGEPVAGGRVGLFRDVDGDGDLGPDDTIYSYADTDADGRYSAVVAEGEYLVRADVIDQGRSGALEVALTSDRTVDLEITRPIAVDYTVVDDATDEPIPARLTVIGESPVEVDERIASTYDTRDRVASTVFAAHGSSLPSADGADPQLMLVPGGDYRVLASRGTEWSVASVRITPQAGDPDGEIELRLRRVVDTDGYLASEYHVHAIGSPDSPVDWPLRIATAAADGVELFASTEHDYVADLQPIVEELGLERVVRVLPGTEATPFTYGHFNAWPMEPDESDPARGAIDWARGADGFALVPGEIFDRMRDRGAELVQVNHPRAVPGALSDFMQYFDRAGLTYDYDARTVTGDLLAQPVPNEFLRLPPDVQMFDLDFNALEVWNAVWFDMADTNGDGERETQGLDVVLRDWFNFLSFGLDITPLGNSDTHNAARTPVGMPRTLVRVDDDSPDALASGSVVASLLDTLTGRSPKDVVVTTGPHIRVMEGGGSISVIGRVLDGSGTGEVTLDIEVQSARWAHFDTIEIFTNAVPDTTLEETAQYPAACFTVTPEADLAPGDPCAVAPLGASPLTLEEIEVAPGFTRFQATVSITLSSAQAALYPEGSSGQDMWVVVRVRGDRAVYPLLLSGVLGGDTLETLVTGTQAEVDAALEGVGTPAVAFTAPIYLDLDGGGYRAPFAPE